MPDVRFWSLTRWILVLSGLVIAVACLAVAYRINQDDNFVKSVRASAPVVAALIALLSLVATSVSLSFNWRRQRRESTLAVWIEWSDKNNAARRTATRLLSMQALTAIVGRAIADNAPVVEGDIDLTDPAIRGEAGRAVVSILNGLERIAVGVNLGVFDASTLRELGGTIIVREFERNRAYIDARRTATNELRRQANAFTALESLVNDFNSRRLREERKDLDRRRLTALRR
ncbi:MAG: DUF4760 domain-containing protein [Ornithinimicrobium sp.]